MNTSAYQVSLTLLTSKPTLKISTNMLRPQKACLLKRLTRR